MAAVDQEIDKTLSQIIEKLSQTEQYLDQLVQQHIAKRAKVLQNLKESVELMNASQEVLKREFYELLTPFCQWNDGNIHNPDLSQLKDEVLRVIGTKGNDELVGLVEGLEGFKKRVDGTNERVIQLMRVLNIVPTCSGIKESHKRKTPLRLSSPANFSQEVGEEKSELGVKRKERGLWRVRDVAIHMYGFEIDIALDIEESLGQRKQIQNEMLFNLDEAAITFDIEDSEDDDEWKEKDSMELNWVEVKKLKKKFEELKKKIYEKQEIDLNVEPKDSGDGDEDPKSLTVQFQRVMRNWIFHIESVLFKFIISELYQMLPGNEKAETIFEDFKSKLKNMMEINRGMVPITVHKIIYMMENPTELKQHGVEIRTPTVSEIGRKRLHEGIILNEVMDQVHEIILRFGSVLASFGLSYTHMIREDELASYEDVLKQSEEEVREIERKIYWGNLEFQFNKLHI